MLTVLQPSSSAEHSLALQDLVERIQRLVVIVVRSPDARKAVRLLQDLSAQYFLDAVQLVRTSLLCRRLSTDLSHKVLRNGSLPTPECVSSARRLMVMLSEVSERFPSSLHITGVSNRDEHATFHGGFGDIFPASHQGNPVALKRLRIFTGDPTTTQRTRIVSVNLIPPSYLLMTVAQKFCREALIWEGLHHPFILPFLGIDSETFPSALCMVSPWMRNGTVLKYLEDHGQGEVDRLVSRIEPDGN